MCVGWQACVDWGVSIRVGAWLRQAAAVACLWIGAHLPQGVGGGKNVSGLEPKCLSVTVHSFSDHSYQMSPQVTMWTAQCNVGSVNELSEASTLEKSLSVGCRRVGAIQGCRTCVNVVARRHICMSVVQEIRATTFQYLVQALCCTDHFHAILCAVLKQSYHHSMPTMFLMLNLPFLVRCLTLNLVSSPPLAAERTRTLSTWMARPRWRWPSSTNRVL